MRVQHSLIFEHDIPIAETLLISALELGISQYWILFPFSRGCVHLSSDPDEPLIDPKLFAIDFDVDVAIRMGRLAQEFWNTSPVNDFIEGQMLPSEEDLPTNATHQQWEDFVRSTSKSRRRCCSSACGHG